MQMRTSSERNREDGWGFENDRRDGRQQFQQHQQVQHQSHPVQEKEPEIDLVASIREFSNRINNTQPHHPQSTNPVQIMNHPHQNSYIQGHVQPQMQNHPTPDGYLRPPQTGHFQQPQDIRFMHQQRPASPNLAQQVPQQIPDQTQQAHFTASYDAPESPQPQPQTQVPQSQLLSHK